MKKLVINSCYGGFSLSPFGVREYAKAKGIELHPFTSDHKTGKCKQLNWDDTIKNALFLHYSTKPIKNGKDDNESYFSDRDIPRDDKHLIEIVENFGDKVDGSCAELRIVEIPDDADWEISEYDGRERVEEKHRSWS